jgi:hypothetical protein
VEETFQGQTYTAFTTAGVVIKARPGRIAKLVVTSAVTGSITIYDNPSAASGTVLFTATTPAVGIVPIDIPAKTGIYLVPGSAGAGILVYS